MKLPYPHQFNSLKLQNDFLIVQPSHMVGSLYFVGRNCDYIHPYSAREFSAHLSTLLYVAIYTGIFIGVGCAVIDQ